MLQKIIKGAANGISDKVLDEKKELYKTGYDFPAMDVDSFIDKVGKLPPRDEIIEGVLPEEEVGIIAGDPWQGKSLEQQKLAYETGVGGNYHGLKVQKCRSGYVTWEGNSQKIANRFVKIARNFNIEPEYKPIIKLLPEPIPINTEDGFNKMKELWKRFASEGCKVLLLDSFPYTVAGKWRDDDVVNAWWAANRKLISETHITPIYVWEFTKLIFDAAHGGDPFDLTRLKGGYTVAYKVNTVVMIGELKVNKRIKGQGVKTVSEGHRIVIAKVKDSEGAFEPLKVTLDRKTLLWNGQHWEFDAQNEVYRAINDGYTLASMKGKMPSMP